MIKASKEITPARSMEKIYPIYIESLLLLKIVWGLFVCLDSLVWGFVVAVLPSV